MATHDLDRIRARKFFKRLAADPFICVVQNEDGGISIFSKDMDDEHVDRVVGVLTEIEEGD